MKNGICIKCGSKEVYHTTDGAQYSLAVNSRWRPIMEFENYLCTECGYLETYYCFDPPDLKEKWKKTYNERIEGIKEHWTKVSKD